VFPRGAFAPSDRFGGAEALQARDDPVARRLLDQLGKGVFAAVKAKYARTITYYVVGPPDVRARVASEDAADAADERKSSHPRDESEADDDERERVLEEYAFTIRYGEQTGAGDVAGDIFENVSVRAGRRGISRKTAWGASPSASSLDDEEKIKDAGDQMLRQLEALIEHLEPAPNGSRIGIRLTYVDATPPEYEPPFFESVEPMHGTIGDGDERRDCGAVETRFHALSLRWTRRIASADRDGAGADDPGARETRVRHAGAAENDGAEPQGARRKASALVPFPFESQPEPEPEPAAECRDYHYLSQSEPQPDSESPGLDAAAPAGPPPKIGWADGFANGPAFSLTGSLSLSRAPPSPFKPVGGGSRGAGRGAGDSAASFSFGGPGVEPRREPGVARRERLARVRRVRRARRARRARRRRVRLAHSPRDRRRGGKARDGKARRGVPHPSLHAVAEAAPLGRRSGHLRRQPSSETRTGGDAQRDA
jgi:hypothetical protein